MTINTKLGPQTKIKQYIGRDKPKIEYPDPPTERLEPVLLHLWELEIEDGDLLRNDQQGYDDWEN